jgi:hypothetical protein
MSRPTIAIYGAADRFNYGDLLFPLILEEAFRRTKAQVDTVAVGIKSSDLSRYGALPTRGLSWMLKPGNLKPGSSIVVAGGELLTAGWWQLLSHLLPPLIGDACQAMISRCIKEKHLDTMSRKLFKCPWEIPYAPDANCLEKGINVAFNAVGGSNLALCNEAWKKNVLTALQSASFASVRDRVTYNLVNGDSSKTQLIPDSAAALPYFFPAAELEKKVSPEIQGILNDPSPFICFQLHRYFKPEKLRKFAAQLDKLQKQERFRIILLPIGHATGHSDYRSLKKIQNAMQQPCDLLGRIKLIDTIALLSRCAVYAGTSLHGLITAMSYGRPYATIGKAPKCLAFLQTWCPQEWHTPARAKDLAYTLAERAATPADTLEAKSLKTRKAALSGIELLVHNTLGQN